MTSELGFKRPKNIGNSSLEKSIHHLKTPTEISRQHFAILYSLTFFISKINYMHENIRMNKYLVVYFYRLSKYYCANM